MESVRSGDGDAELTVGSGGGDEVVLPLKVSKKAKHEGVRL